MLFFSRCQSPLLGEEVIVGNNHGFRTAGAQFLPFVTPDFSFGIQLHDGTLHRLSGSILSLELRVNHAARVGFVDGEFLGSDATAILKYAEGTAINFLSVVLLLFLFWRGSGRCAKAPSQSQDESEHSMRARQLHYDSPVPERTFGIRDGSADSGPQNCKVRSISAQMDAGSLPEVTIVTFA